MQLKAVDAFLQGRATKDAPQLHSASWGRLRTEKQEMLTEI
jgi:hypothetical protein